MKCLSAVAILLFVIAAIVEGAPLLYADSKTAIPGKYIVVLHENLTLADRDDHIFTLKNRITASQADSEIEFVYGIGNMLGFSARLDAQTVKNELEHPDVKYIEVDQTVQLAYFQDPVQGPDAVITQSGATWGIDRIDQRDLPLDSRYIYNDNGGSGTDAYVIDTGVYTAHSEFEGRASAPFNAVTGESAADGNGHGTHCAGTIGGKTYGVAKKVTIFGIKVLSSTGSGTNAGVISGVDYVTNKKRSGRVSIASMSLGGGASTALDNAVSSSIASGVIYAIAAGNENQNACNTSPARVAGAVTVGATERTDARASYSNWGSCLDIFAPGSSITSAWIGGTTATNTISGTSMATPHVAGVLALQKSINSGFSKNSLIDAATTNKVTNPQTGSPNRLLYSAH